MYQALGKATHLYRENLVARGIHILACRNERMWINVAQQSKVAWLNNLCRNDNSLRRFGCMYKRCVLATLCTQLLNIYLTY